MNDSDLFHTIKTRLFTAVVGDVLDVLGYRHQFLPQEIKPLVPGTAMVGRAMTVLEASYPEGGRNGPLSDQAFGLMFQALDDLQEGEIYIAAGNALDFATWGGLMSTRATHLKAAGAVVNGFHRDSAEIRNLGFPTFSRGSYAQDQGPRGKVLDWRLPVEIGGVAITDGDLIFGDDEGVLVIPRAVEAEAIERALAKADTENKVATAIKDGMSTVDAFATFGVM
ncbi:MAG: RraA family protein [Sphingomonadales bacterium]|nr:RraA family protein [Sphingomonadales bacterium]